jgi:hypothetical protein
MFPKFRAIRNRHRQPSMAGSLQGWIMPLAIWFVNAAKVQARGNLPEPFENLCPRRSGA